LFYAIFVRILAVFAVEVCEVFTDLVTS